MTAAAGAALPLRLAAAGAAAKPGWAGYPGAVIVDALGSPGGNATGADDSGEDGLSAADLADIRASGITAVNLTVGGIGNGTDVFEETFKTIGYWEREIDAHPDLLMKVKSAADLEKAKASGRLGIIYGFQDGSPLAEDPDRVDLFARFGVRIIQLTYNRRNLLGDGCLEPGDAGLSRVGRAMVERMNARGLLVDLSHCGRRTPPWMPSRPRSSPWPSPTRAARRWPTCRATRPTKSCASSPTRGAWWGST